MTISRRAIKRYIEHFLRYSASVNYKNITLSLMTVGAAEWFSLNSNYIRQGLIQQYLFLTFQSFPAISFLLPNPPDFDIYREMEMADTIHYICNTSAISFFSPSGAELLRDALPLEFMSSEGLATIDNVLRILLYCSTLKFFIDAIPPFMPKGIDLYGALLHSLMNQQKDPYFHEIIAKMIKEVNLTESDLEKSLKGAGVWVRSTYTHGAILFPITTNAGRSYDMADLFMLKARKDDPLTRGLLTGIYFNPTLFSIIHHGIRDILNQDPVLSDQEKEAFMVQCRRIKENLKNLLQEQPADIQAEKEEPSLFVTALSRIAVIAHVIHHFIILPIIIPFAFQKEVGGWQNPLPQLCEDLDNRSYDLWEAFAKETQNWSFDSHIIFHLMIFFQILLILILGPLVFLGNKLFRGNPEGVRYIEGTLSLLENNLPSSVQEEEDGPTLQQLHGQYQEILSQPDAERDKLTTLLLCTGCSSSYFKAARHEPCKPGAELVIDYDTTQLVADFRLAPPR